MKKFFKIFIQFYLKILTKIILWRKKPKIIAIAGTTNKTFVKDKLLEELGSGNNFIRGNPRSFNTEIGLPLAVLFLPSGYSSIFKWVDILFTGTFFSFFSRKFPKILVLEMGVDKKGDMKYLLSIIKPFVAIITNIDRSFPHHKTSLNDLADEMKFLIEAVPPKGLVILNGDDKRVAKLKDFSKAKTVLYGFNKQCEFLISDVEGKISGQRFKLVYNGQKELIDVEKFGKHNIYSLVIAKIIANELSHNFFNDKNQ